MITVMRASRSRLDVCEAGGVYDNDFVNGYLIAWYSASVARDGQTVGWQNADA